MQKKDYGVFDAPRKAQKKIEVETNLTVGTLVEHVVRFEIQEMERITRYADNVTIPSEEQLMSYLLTTLYYRVKIGRSERTDIPRSVLRQYRVPARWYTILDNVGEAHDNVRNIRFLPKLTLAARDSDESVDQDNMNTRTVYTCGNYDIKLMTKPDLKEISDLLEAFYDDGYVTIKGVPQDYQGSIHFMAKSTISDIIMGMDMDHPVYAFLAAVLEAEVMADTYSDLDLLFRVQYGSVDTYFAGFRNYFKHSVDYVDDEAEREAQPESGISE